MIPLAKFRQFIHHPSFKRDTGCTPVRPLDAARPAWRDVLVLTLRAEDTTSTAAHG